MGWLGRVGQGVKVRGMFLHPTQVASVLRKFPEIERHQSVVTRVDLVDQVTLQVVATGTEDAEALRKSLQTAARDALKFRLNVTVVSAADLPKDAPTLDDQRDWD